MTDTQQIIDAVQSFLNSPSEPSPFVMASKRFNYNISNDVAKDPRCMSFPVSNLEQAKSVLKSVVRDKQDVEDNIKGFEFDLDKSLYLIIHKVN